MLFLFLEKLGAMSSLTVASCAVKASEIGFNSGSSRSGSWSNAYGVLLASFCYIFSMEAIRGVESIRSFGISIIG